MKLRNIPFSPPDMTAAEAEEAKKAILSGWITTGPKTKEFEKRISEYVGSDRTVCLNSATAALEMALRLLGIGAEDEVNEVNMTDIMAGIGLAQLDRYDSMLKRRQEIVVRYNEALAECNVEVLNHKGDDHCSSHHLYLVRLLGKTREQVNSVIEEMARRGIACNVHYKPLPMMTAYRALGFDIKDYPNAYRLFENEITLPLHTRLTDEDVEYVIANFVEIVKGLDTTKSAAGGYRSVSEK